jgi:hypothetical protein
MEEILNMEESRLVRWLRCLILGAIATLALKIMIPDRPRKPPPQNLTLTQANQQLLGKTSREIMAMYGKPDNTYTYKNGWSERLVWEYLGKPLVQNTSKVSIEFLGEFCIEVRAK